jgi:hypothetical protein
MCKLTLVYNIVPHGQVQNSSNKLNMAWSETPLIFLWCCWVEQQSKAGGRRAIVILPLIWFGWGTKRSWRDMGCCFCITSSTWQLLNSSNKSNVSQSAMPLTTSFAIPHGAPSRLFISSRTYYSFPDVACVVSYSQTTIEYLGLLFICCKVVMYFTTKISTSL